MIKFEDFFSLNGLKYNGEEIKPEQVKVKFNMNDNNGKETREALYLLLNDEDGWNGMNAWYEKKTPHYFGDAKYVLSFAQYSQLGRNYFVFGGLYKVQLNKNAKNNSRGYDFELLQHFLQYRKRIVIKTQENVGQMINRTYQNVCCGRLSPEIYEMLPLDSVDLGPFPGYSNIILSFNQLKGIKNSDDWKVALSSVKGIYCITDKSNGKLYIGSATGKDGILGRWNSYIDSIDGGNKTLKDINGKKGDIYIKDNFQYSILEVFDTKTRQEDILRKEYHWMRVFQSVTKGYNNSASRDKYNIEAEENDNITEKKFEYMDKN